jgi:hypothetical protein
MLGGDADLAREPRIVLEREDDRGQLDGLGTRAEDDGYFAHFARKVSEELRVKSEEFKGKGKDS